MTSWRRIRIAIPVASRELLITALHEQGTLGVEEREGAIDAYFSEPVDVGALFRSLQASLGPRSAEARLESSTRVADGRWHERWLETLTPFPLGERFVILPHPGSHFGVAKRKPIRLVPGLAFGTGDHPTTSDCVRMIERFVRAGDSFLDVGTGSGILAIAASMLGATNILAIDIDEEAVRTARQNVRRNGIRGINLVVGGMECLVLPQTDVLVANLNGTSLMRLLPELIRIRSRWLILSGLLQEEENMVRSAMESRGLAVSERSSNEGWITLVSRGRS